MTKRELKDIFYEKYLLEQAMYERLTEVCNLLTEYLASDDESYVYLVTSTGYRSDTIDEVNLATLDEAEAKRFYKELQEKSISWKLRLYKIPMDSHSESHTEPMGKTTWLSDCMVNSVVTESSEDQEIRL